MICGEHRRGSREVIVNARKLADTGATSPSSSPEQKCRDEVTAILSASSKNFVIRERDAPIQPTEHRAAREEIKKLFIERIVQAKGLSRAQALAANEIIPTPLAVMNGCELLSKGTGNTEGIGDLMAIDIGGATTDVYSMSHGHPTLSNVLVKGLPEPYAKRSVEGDLGMRYSLRHWRDSRSWEVARDRFPGRRSQAWIGACRRFYLLAVEVEQASKRPAARCAVSPRCATVDRGSRSTRRLDRCSP